MKELKTISTGISIYIKDWLIQENSLKFRSFYGEIFSLLLLKQTSILDSQAFSILLKEYDKKDKNASDFHFEFNNYAFINFLKLVEDKEIRERLLPLRFKNTPCTNWTLLRSNARILCKVDTELALKEAKAKISRFQLKNGLILDDKGVKSFQYHCFSMAMIAEIYEETKDSFFLNSFILGVSFIRNFILPNGDTLYIGRGQEQSFGYGTLIYILALYNKLVFDDTVLVEIELVLSFLKKYRLDKGNFPLVMNKIQPVEPENVNLMDKRFAGWYAYNNYFDYLPFMGVFMFKAWDILRKNEVSVSNKRITQKNYQDGHFRKIVREDYVAIISKPGGYWSNDIPIPLIYYNGEVITPCYGGEQYVSGLCDEKAIPLPFFDKLNKSIRWRCFSFLIQNYLIVINPLGIMIRHFNYGIKEINIKTFVLSFFKFKNIFVNIKNASNKFEITCNRKLKKMSGNWVTANGEVELYYSRGKRQIINIKLL